MNKAALFTGNTPKNIEERVWFFAQTKKKAMFCWIIITQPYLFFKLKDKYFLLWTKIEYYCLLAFVKCKLLRFCSLVFSPWDFFVIMFGYHKVSLSQYMIVPITVSQPVLITVFFLFHLKVTEYLKNGPFDLQFNEFFLCATHDSTPHSFCSALLKSLFHFYKLHGKCLLVTRFHASTFDIAFNCKHIFWCC